MQNFLRSHLASVTAAAAFGLAVATVNASPASAFATGQSTLKGTVTSFDGKFDLHVRDRSGEIHDVQLHPGTIINPTGLTLRDGMKVTILGDDGGGALDATEIDTPYHLDQAYVNDGADVAGYPYGNGAYGNEAFGTTPYGFAYPYYGGGYGSAYGYGAYPYYGGAYGNGYGYGGYPYGYGSPGQPQQYVNGYPRAGGPVVPGPRTRIPLGAAAEPHFQARPVFAPGPRAMAPTTAGRR